MTRSTRSQAATPHSPDQALIAAAQADPRRFAELYDLHFSRIYAFVLARSETRADAEDITAETFRRAIDRIAGFEWQGVPFAAWLYRIASNAVTDHRRALGRRRRSEHPTTTPEDAAGEAALAPGPDPDEERRLERRALVFELVERLPESQRQVIRLRFVDGRSVEETAARLGRSTGAVKQLQHRAVSRLRTWVEARSPDDV